MHHGVACESVELRGVSEVVIIVAARGVMPTPF